MSESVLEKSTKVDCESTSTTIEVILEQGVNCGSGDGKLSTVVEKEAIIDNKHSVTFPQGEYQLVTWDLDLTGRRLLDEICQISAFIPGSSFSQYVMPYRRPNPGAQHRHNIRVVSIGRYRVMKNIITGKILKTKSEISALSDFITWLEKIQGKDGVILLSFEPRKVIPHILLEALRKYNLMESFSAVVKGFTNGHYLAEAKYTKSTVNHSLNTMGRILLNKEVKESSAIERTRLAYEVALKLCSEDEVTTVSAAASEQGSGDNAAISAKNIVNAISEFTLSIAEEEAELSELKALLTRQGTFRPVFGPMIQKNRRERQRASVQRQLIAEAGIDYVMLADAFKANGKDGIAKMLSDKLTKANSSAVEELLKLLVDHFDPPPMPKEIIANAGKVEEQTEEIKTEDADIKATTQGSCNDSAGINSSTPLEDLSKGDASSSPKH